jgi:hypothetical protein
MNTGVDTFRALLAHYKLSEPVSPELQEYIIRQRKSDFKRLLRKTGQLGLMFWFSVLVYETLKEAGIKLSIIQAKIVAGITATAIASGSAAGVYKGATYIREAVIKIKAETEEKIEKDGDSRTGPDRNHSGQGAPTEVKRDGHRTGSIDIIKKNGNGSKSIDAEGEKQNKNGGESGMISDVPTL